MLIDLFQDTVCPWCRIGKANLKIALAEWQGEAVEIRYRSFFLDPTIPPEGKDFASHMLAKGGGRMSLQDFFDAPREMGAKVGLTFNFEAITRAPNTRLSHRLAYLTPEDQRETLIDALYAAYFEDGRDIGDLDELLRIAAENGFNPPDLRQQLLGTQADGPIQADLLFAQQAGISGVPFFIVNQKLAFSGAQPPQLIAKVLAQASA